MHLALYVVASLVGLLIADLAQAQPNGSWYYCDTSHAYYPYVGTCTAPWRAVAPNALAPQAGASAAPPPLSPAPPAPTEPPSAAFQQGQADRQSWEDWFSSLTDE